MLNVVSSDSGFEREHEVKRSLKTSSKVKVSNDGAPKAQTKKGMTSKSSKEKGERKRPRVYSGEAKEAIAKMAVKEGDRKAAEYYTKELGHHVHAMNAHRFKKAYMKNRNMNGDKGSVELQCPDGQEETGDNEKDQDKEVGGNLDEEVGGNLDEELGGNLDEEVGCDQDKEAGGDAKLDQVSAH